MPNYGAILLPCASKVRLSTPRGASAVRNLVNLLDHELTLQSVSCTLSVVGIALSPTVGPLLFHQLKVGSAVLLVIHNTSRRRLLSTACLRCVAQRLSVTFATLRALALDVHPTCIILPHASPRAARGWLAAPQPLSPPRAKRGLLSCSE